MTANSCEAIVCLAKDAGAGRRLDDLLGMLHQLETAATEATPMSKLSAGVLVLLGNPPAVQVVQPAIGAQAISVDEIAAAKEESDARGLRGDQGSNAVRREDGIRNARRFSGVPGGLRSR